MTKSTRVRMTREEELASINKEIEALQRSMKEDAKVLLAASMSKEATCDIIRSYKGSLKKMLKEVEKQTRKRDKLQQLVLGFVK